MLATKKEPAAASSADLPPNEWLTTAPFTISAHATAFRPPSHASTSAFAPSLATAAVSAPLSMRVSAADASLRRHASMRAAPPLSAPPPALRKARPRSGSGETGEAAAITHPLRLRLKQVCGWADSTQARRLCAEVQKCAPRPPIQRAVRERRRDAFLDGPARPARPAPPQFGWWPARMHIPVVCDLIYEDSRSPLIAAITALRALLFTYTYGVLSSSGLFVAGRTCPESLGKPNPGGEAASVIVFIGFTLLAALASSRSQSRRFVIPAFVAASFTSFSSAPSSSPRATSSCAQLRRAAVQSRPLSWTLPTPLSH